MGVCRRKIVEKKNIVEVVTMRSTTLFCLFGLIFVAFTGYGDASVVTSAAASQGLEVELEIGLEFDYKCLVCQWAAKAIILYHKEDKKPKALFSVLSVLCSLLGHQDKVVKTTDFMG